MKTRKRTVVHLDGGTRFATACGLERPLSPPAKCSDEAKRVTCKSCQGSLNFKNLVAIRAVPEDLD